MTASPFWPGFPPWSHQQIAFDLAVQHIEQARQAGRPFRGIIQMPTATGKTALARALTFWFLTDSRRQAALCLPTEEILGQFADGFRRETRIPFHIEKAQQHAPGYSRIILASQQTVWRRLDGYDRKRFVFFDEIHHVNELAPTNRQTVGSFDQVLGLSASPWSSDCEVIAGEVIYRYTLSEAIAQRRVPTIVFVDWEVQAPQPWELYYCPDNETARAYAHACSQSAYLCGDTRSPHGRPEYRRGVVAAFRAGRLKRLYVNRLLVEGFDCPQIKRIYIEKESDSDILNYQMVGRGLRLCAGRPTTLEIVCRPSTRAAIQQALRRAG